MRHAELARELADAREVVAIADERDARRGTEQRARVLPYKNAADFERIADGLREAGLSGEPG